MPARRRFRTIIVLALAAALALAASAAHAGLKDRLKKKFDDKAAQKTDQAADKAIDGSAGAAGADAGESGEPGSEGSAGGGDGGQVSDVSTKFDFVPGDRVLFLDDFTQDELGEFPARWTLVLGTWEVAEMKGERWFRCASPDGRVRMKLPAMETLPEFWTLEFDFYGVEPIQSGFTLRGMTGKDQAAWEGSFPQGQSMVFRSGEIFSDTPIDPPAVITGRHHIMFMARGKTVKAYVDRQRMVSVPDVSAVAGMPREFEFRFFAPCKPMMANVRFAEGCKPAKDMLASGKLVTYGIRFASGSDVVEPESAPVLRQIAAYLEANPTVKLEITGHTDNTGTSAGNLDLSKRRAAAVAKVLTEEFKIAAERLPTDGKGDTEALAKNDAAEGRAMNRRVEFKKV